jgi:non-canonical purine NTP pyrophosphatase (RdgB/HAM1 family)
MALKFISGNKNKFAEITAMLAPFEVEQCKIDLVEIQSLDAQEIIRHKLKEALKHQQAEFIVEDTSLYLDCLGDKLPGPFVKWFLEGVGISGLANLALSQGNTKARAVTILGYAKNGVVKFFTGENLGQIVDPVGDKDFGWGPIFKPSGSTKTYGEMEREEKYSFSMRALAAQQLKTYLQSQVDHAPV